MNICALVRNFSCVVPGSWWELHCRWWLDQVRCLKTSGNSCTGMLRTNVLLSDPFIYSEHLYSTHSRCLLGHTPSPVCESNLFQVLMKCTYTKWCTDKGSSLAQQIWQSNYFKGHCWIVFAIAALAENCFWIHSVSQFPSCDRFFCRLVTRLFYEVLVKITICKLYLLYKALRSTSDTTLLGLLILYVI